MAKEPGLAALRYPIWSEKHRTHFEPDLLLLHPRWGLVVVEVKGFRIADVAKVSGQVWTLASGLYAKEHDPTAQAKAQMYAWVDHFKAHGVAFRGTPVVALPRIRRAEWARAGFDADPSKPFLLFEEDLAPSALGDRLEAFCAGHRQPEAEAFAKALKSLELLNPHRHRWPRRLARGLWPLWLALALLAVGAGAAWRVGLLRP